MSGKTNSIRKTERHQATVDEIVDAAWELSREQGLAGFSLRDLGARVGMRAQSLYTYFSSKNDIYDAMFLDGNRAFLAAMDGLEPPSGEDPSAAVEVARAIGHRYFDFCTADPVRYQLLFQRTIPEFTPSSASYSVAQVAYDKVVAVLAEIGVATADVDLWTAVVTGLVSQQLANDPGGDRWRQLVDRATDMVLADVAPHLFDTESTRRTS
jgi:AcrR family transcriptional regulator